MLTTTQSTPRPKLHCPHTQLLTGLQRVNAFNQGLHSSTTLKPLQSSLVLGRWTDPPTGPAKRFRQYSLCRCRKLGKQHRHGSYVDLLLTLCCSYTTHANISLDKILQIGITLGCWGVVALYRLCRNHLDPHR